MYKIFLFILTLFNFSLANTVNDSLKKLTDNLYGVFGVSQQVNKENKGFISNAYFYITDDGVIVFDALSSYLLGKELVKTIKSISDKPIKYLIITHYHTDHFYGIKAFKDEGAVSIAHKWAYDYLSDPYAEQFFKSRQKVLGDLLKGTKIIPPDIAIDKEIILNVSNQTIDVQHICQGHTKGDLIIWIPKIKTLIAGDLIFNERVPFLGSGNSKSWLKCIDKIIQLKPEIVLPGHGDILKGKDEILKKANLTKSYIIDMRKLIKKMIDEYGYDVETVKSRIVKDMYKVNPVYKNIKLFEKITPTNAYYIYFEVERELFME